MFYFGSKGKKIPTYGPHEADKNTTDRTVQSKIWQGVRKNNQIKWRVLRHFLTKRTETFRDKRKTQFLISRARTICFVLVLRTVQRE